MTRCDLKLNRKMIKECQHKYPDLLRTGAFKLTRGRSSLPTSVFFSNSLVSINKHTCTRPKTQTKAVPHVSHFLSDFVSSLVWINTSHFSHEPPQRSWLLSVKVTMVMTYRLNRADLRVSGSSNPHHTHTQTHTCCSPCAHMNTTIVPV